MTRRNFFQVLQDAQIDLWKEYQRLNNLFYYSENFKIQSIYQTCEEYFINMPFRDTCLNINDFNDTHDFHFRDITEDTFSENDLIIFCEYSYNFVYQLMKNPYCDLKYFQFYVKQLNLVNDKIGYKFYQNENEVFILIPKDQAVNSVVEIVDDDLSYKVIEYNHHSMKGDIEGKRAILQNIALKLEEKRKDLRQLKSIVDVKLINQKLEDNIFLLINNLNIRHNNISPKSDNCFLALAFMSNEELENWYDEIYQLCLLAFLELEYLERTPKIDKLKELIIASNKIKKESKK